VPERAKLFLLPSQPRDIECHRFNADRPAAGFGFPDDAGRLDEY